MGVAVNANFIFLRYYNNSSPPGMALLMTVVLQLWNFYEVLTAGQGFPSSLHFFISFGLVIGEFSGY